MLCHLDTEDDRIAPKKYIAFHVHQPSFLVDSFVFFCVGKFFSLQSRSTPAKLADNRGIKKEYHKLYDCFQFMQMANHEIFLCLLSQKVPVSAKRVSHFCLYLIFEVFESMIQFVASKSTENQSKSRKKKFNSVQKLDRFEVSPTSYEKSTPIVGIFSLWNDD